MYVCIGTLLGTFYSWYLNNSVLMSCFILHDIINKYYCSPFNRAEFNIPYLIRTIIRINENMVFVSSKFCLIMLFWNLNTKL